MDSAAKFREEHPSISQVPSCSVQIRASPTLSLTLPYSIIFTLRQDHHLTGGPERRPVLVHWSPYQALILNKFKLFHHGKEGLEELQIDDRLSEPAKKVQELSIHSQDPLSIPPDANLDINTGLPIEYYKHLQVGEKYSLMWPRNEIHSWSFTDYQNVRDRRDVDATDFHVRSPIVLPATQPIDFTVVEEATPWPDRSRWEACSLEQANYEEWRWRQSQERQQTMSLPKLVKCEERNPDAPFFSLSLRGESKLFLSGKYSYYITVHYHADSGTKSSGNVVTFRTSYISDITETDRYTLVRYGVDGAEQIPEDDEVCGFPGAVEEYSEVLVGKNDAFTSLAPGESHTTGPIQFYPNHYFLKDFEVGANYSYQYTGGDISWWDWGTKESHQETKINIYDTSHDKRPRLVLPASNTMNFTVVNDSNDISLIPAHTALR